MPFTPYHFGPSGFFGLLFRKWLDIPVFVLANVVVDIEVLVIVFSGLGPPIHRYCHTLLFGTAVGALWGIAAYPLRHFFKRLMHLFNLPYETSFWKLVLSGILGVWLHVLIDGAYHSEVRVLWPFRATHLWLAIRRHLDKGLIEDICVSFFLAAILLYAIVLTSSRERDTNKK
jgi:membrane-bound metal-dependent hydrolase YbcI (DUF457 family)